MSYTTAFPLSVPSQQAGNVSQIKIQTKLQLFKDISSQWTTLAQLEHWKSMKHWHLQIYVQFIFISLHFRALQMWKNLATLWRTNHSVERHRAAAGWPKRFSSFHGANWAADLRARHCPELYFTHCPFRAKCLGRHNEFLSCPFADVALQSIFADNLKKLSIHPPPVSVFRYLIPKATLQLSLENL